MAIIDNTNYSLTGSQVKDLANMVNGKQDTLTAGTNITISGSTISATDTTYNDFTGADASTAGAHGLVPAPAAGDNTKYLRGDGTWQTASYTLPAATTSTLGGVIVGSGLSVQGDGTISADAQSSTISAQDWTALWA